MHSYVWKVIVAYMQHSLLERVNLFRNTVKDVLISTIALKMHLFLYVAKKIQHNIISSFCNLQITNFSSRYLQSIQNKI